MKFFLLGLVCLYVVSHAASEETLTCRDKIADLELRCMQLPDKLKESDAKYDALAEVKQSLMCSKLQECSKELAAPVPDCFTPLFGCARERTENATCPERLHIMKKMCKIEMEKKSKDFESDKDKADAVKVCNEMDTCAEKDSVKNASPEKCYNAFMTCAEADSFSCPAVYDEVKNMCYSSAGPLEGRPKSDTLDRCGGFHVCKDNETVMAQPNQDACLRSLLACGERFANTVACSERSDRFFEECTRADKMKGEVSGMCKYSKACETEIEVTSASKGSSCFEAYMACANRLNSTCQDSKVGLVIQCSSTTNLKTVDGVRKVVVCDKMKTCPFRTEDGEDCADEFRNCAEKKARVANCVELWAVLGKKCEKNNRFEFGADESKLLCSKANRCLTKDHYLHNDLLKTTGERACSKHFEACIDGEKPDEPETEPEPEPEVNPEATGCFKDWEEYKAMCVAKNIKNGMEDADAKALCAKADICLDKKDEMHQRLAKMTIKGMCKMKFRQCVQKGAKAADGGAVKDEQPLPGPPEDPNKDKDGAASSTATTPGVREIEPNPAGVHNEQEE